MRLLPSLLGQSRTDPPQPQSPPAVPIRIDVAAGRHPISSLIYGVSFGSSETLADLGATVNRSGGDSASLYNWRIDARNAGRDWFFESLPCTSSLFDQFGDGFVALSKAGRARAMLTVPMLGWVARLGPQRSPLASFSIAKYGLQHATDRSGLAEAGDGVSLEGSPVKGNDPHDAAQPQNLGDGALWLKHLVTRWGAASAGGVAFYALDNEPSQWHIIHRDVHPRGLHASELAATTVAYAALVRAADPSAKIVAPEEAGWAGLKDSGFDQQRAGSGDLQSPSDRTAQTGGMDLLPWLLTQWKRAGHPVDVVSVHFYPQAGEYRDGGDDNTVAMQLRRNRSTRLLWDPAYKDGSWLPEKIALLPLLRGWVDRYYEAGTPVALTEYNWGGENTMNGATAEADLLGIFGREGLYLATRWAAPARDSPTYLAMKLFRNADSKHGGFGETSVQVTVPQPDEVSAFAAVRTRDKALTVIAINKQIEKAAPISLLLDHFPRTGEVETICLVAGKLGSLPSRRFHDGSVQSVLPAQSVTLFTLQPNAH